MFVATMKEMPIYSIRNLHIIYLLIHQLLINDENHVYGQVLE